MRTDVEISPGFGYVQLIMTENKTTYIIPTENLQRLEDRANEFISKGKTDMVVGSGFGIQYALDIFKVFEVNE